MGVAFYVFKPLDRASDAILRRFLNNFVAQGVMAFLRIVTPPHLTLTFEHDLVGKPASPVPHHA
jgi:hypothetical protein